MHTATAAADLPYTEFPGCARFYALLDAAVALGTPEAVTDALRQALITLIHDPSIRLPDAIRQPVAGHYARRELYRSPRYGYSVVAMTWGPGQSTPLHDHDGRWCVEGVWEGELEVSRYELIDSDGERARFYLAETLRAAPGSAGSLIPPHEYHILRNPHDDAVAVSVHVYQAPLTQCARFHHDRDDWYVREQSCLTTDTID
ncbi:MAG: cysteine dioxygenase family protein [Thermomonas hydrothermalis]|uniref:cysteine dioxygenase family protein n=1 Tax=Thermomonas hydrothermalis TaxID=213588 RepID=UPI0023530AEF|nr:cysteine dioxygenase family protein [Thermomonas hydrothermalis]MCL6619963.1 cysteine dioxygenase family protein [Thermomonas hydrothermalis]